MTSRRSGRSCGRAQGGVARSSDCGFKKNGSHLTLHQKIRLTMPYIKPLKTIGLFFRGYMLSLITNLRSVENTESSIMSNPKCFWKYVHKNIGGISFFTAVCLDGAVISNICDLCELFSKYFSFVYTASFLN